ncbi:MAG: ATP-binding protein [Spirochaetia bacterium]|nr:ATP-binding protein [Spirochaetia bacterium]
MAILSIIVILLASVMRRPFTSTKITFSIFAIALSVWNGLEFYLNTAPEGGEFVLSRILLSHLTLYSLGISALHFPFYSRREPTPSFFMAFLGGVGYVIVMLTIFTPFVERTYPLESNLYFKINFYLSRSFDLMCMVSFLGIAFIKLTSTVPALRRTLYIGLTLICISTLVVGIYNFEFNDNKDLLNSKYLILYIDSILLILLGLALTQYKFISFYPGILSIFINGEIPRLMVQKTAQANIVGAAYLKEEIWRLYEVEHWSLFLSEFWFSIIVDETLGNALLHGGKRNDDELIFQVFETSKFLDFYVIDMGKGFDPRTILAPSEDGESSTGKGIYIMRKLFQVDWNFLGNEIRVRVSKNPDENPKQDVLA